MILHIDIDASYLSEPRAFIRTGGYYCLSLLTADTEKDLNLCPPSTEKIHMECRILKHVVVSTAKAEVGGLFHNGQTSVPLRIKLRELGFPQPPTPIKTDNSAAEVIVTATVRQKKFQGNAYVILLDEGQGETKILLSLLETMKSKYGRLFHKSSPTTSS